MNTPSVLGFESDFEVVSKQNFEDESEIKMSDETALPKVGRRYEELLAGMLEMVGSLELPEVLQTFVNKACEITGARYGALSVLDAKGETQDFYSYGFTSADGQLLAHPPVGRGIIGLIGDVDYEQGMIVNNLREHRAFTGFPSGHPLMRNFLGAPLRLHEQVFGRLYLTEKAEDFSPLDLRLVAGLARVAAVSIENSRLYANSLEREAWMGASQRITRSLLESGDEEEALEYITSEILKVSEADAALLVLPSLGDAWISEIVAGEDSADLLGLSFPPHGRAQTVIAEGQGLIVDSMQQAITLRVSELARFGSAMYVPLLAREQAMGVLILLRKPGKPEFAFHLLNLAQNVLSQAALALEIAAANQKAELAQLLDEKAKIGEDLHDLVIQQLFATGMQLDRVRSRIREGEVLQSEEAVGLFDQALRSVDDSIRQIRQIVHNLREPDSKEGLVERVRREAALARSSLGFAPSLLISLDGEMLGEAGGGDQAVEGQSGAVEQRINDLVDQDLADDIVAVCRETLSNIARHAHAHSARVLVEVFTGGARREVMVWVSDDGKGIDPAVSRRSGLDNLASRARRHGGGCVINPGPEGLGTSILWHALMQ